MSLTLYDYCMESGKANLLMQWVQEHNGELTPKDVARGSRRKVLWRCEKGHEWLAEIKSRTDGQSCPVCANRRIVPGENDFTVSFPAVAAQWHPERNGRLDPRTLPYGSRKKVWWRCEKDHEWEASIASRCGTGRGCPVCAGKMAIPGENDLAHNYPAIAAQWHPTKNGTLLPTELTSYSNRKVWWICGEGHEWQCQVSHRAAHDSGCPYCAGTKVLAGFNDLATKEPKLAKQWHPSLNGSLTPQMVTPGSRKKVWWQCPAGHVWHAVVSSRATGRRHGCPVCAGKISQTKQRRYEELAEGINITMSAAF